MSEVESEIRGPLVQARFVSRPNRFIVHAALDSSGEEVRTHLPDPGRSRELLVPDATLWLRDCRGQGRKTEWSCVLVQASSGTIVSLDTQLPNKLVGAALRAGQIDRWSDWTFVRSEIPIDGSRFDFLLERGDEQLALEVKSVTLVDQAGLGQFPDAVTARGTRHVEELTTLAQRPGWRGGILFVGQRDDIRQVTPAEHIDPKFAAALVAAKKAGVAIAAHRATVTNLGQSAALRLGGRIPVVL